MLIRNPLPAILAVLVLLAGVWLTNLLVYGDDDEELPAWLVASWLILLALLVVLVMWAAARLVRARSR